MCQSPLRRPRRIVVALALALGLGATTPLAAQPGACDMTGYAARPGLTAVARPGGVELTWMGAVPGEQVRMELVVDAGTPVIHMLAMRAGSGRWQVIATNARPDIRVVTAMRRITSQQLRPLNRLGTKVTQEVIDAAKWEAFWDAPLRTGDVEGADEHADVIRPATGIASQPGLPRRADEVQRSTARYDVRGCMVTTDGARINVTFPGVMLGVFGGALQYTVYRGTSLIKQEVQATTALPSVAYKYDAGLSGLRTTPATRLVWRDIAGSWTGNTLGGGVNANPVAVQTGNRLIAAEGQAGALALFPPPHNFFWAREITYNLGYSWYRKDAGDRFSLGVRQAEEEASPAYAGRGADDTRNNFALYSAPPGSLQRMTAFLMPSLGDGRRAVDAALALTRNDRYQALPGHKVLLAHAHTNVVRRQAELRQTADAKPSDFDAVRATGVNVFAPIDGGAAGTEGTPTPDQYLINLGAVYDLAIRHSDRTFSVMPNTEVTEGELPALVEALGGHWDLHVSHPTYFTQGRRAGQPLVEPHARYGRIYRLGGADDVMEMMTREGMVAYMPHPRSKGSTGFPDAIRGTARFRAQPFRGIGYRWGMGLDRSEQRLCERRCLRALDDMNNWIAGTGLPLKHIEAISEFYQQGPGDDIYGNTPVNYLELDRLPEPGNWKPIVDALRDGRFFVTSGEILVTNYAVRRQGSGHVAAFDLEWTFPMEFMELVWGDGTTTGSTIVSGTDMGAFGKRHVEIPFDAAGKRWVRFAAWDTAGNGALTQPVRLGR